MTDTPKSEAIDWIPSCGGNFAQATACGKCSTCLYNLKRIAESTPLGKQYKDLLTKHERVLKALEAAESALEVYAMTNETFPEYGTVAKETLAQIESIKNGGWR